MSAVGELEPTPSGGSVAGFYVAVGKRPGDDEELPTTQKTTQITVSITQNPTPTTQIATPTTQKTTQKWTCPAFADG